MGAQGTADLDFGAFPGDFQAQVAVTGQAGIVAGSLAEAWLRPVDTADHLADEHMVEDVRIWAGNIVAGTGFTVYGFHDHVQGGTAVKTHGVWKVGWVWN